jgi:hypothetical protein
MMMLYLKDKRCDHAIITASCSDGGMGPTMRTQRPNEYCNIQNVTTLFLLI